MSHIVGVYKVMKLIRDYKQSCIHIPLIQPGNLESRAVSISSGDIQFPRVPFTPCFFLGTVSCFSSVDMNVLLSTLATSAGSVVASQLFGKMVHIFSSGCTNNSLSLLWTDL